MSAFQLWRSGPDEVLIAEESEFRLLVHQSADDRTTRCKIYQRDTNELVSRDALIASGHRDDLSTATQAAQRAPQPRHGWHDRGKGKLG